MPTDVRDLALGKRDIPWRLRARPAGMAPALSRRWGTKADGVDVAIDVVDDAPQRFSAVIGRLGIGLTHVEHGPWHEVIRRLGRVRNGEVARNRRLSV
ncbi:hypothetical protein SAMD00023353_6000260 [Rosellinia necatrix]|uniref:Uncharacterized protein n=1 Tax=Rosellinia necatrix TaxID=77044 RepID=A0A1S8AA82_ROSNE|nr:hypothetical protein SAMD00023353_6000260 [Rosellinia necatrix]